MSTFRAMLDTSQYVRVSLSLTGVIFQSHRDTVRLAFSDTQPAIDSDAFHELNGAVPLLQLDSRDKDTWALATTDNASLTITELL